MAAERGRFCFFLSAIICVLAGFVYAEMLTLTVFSGLKIEESGDVTDNWQDATDGESFLLNIFDVNTDANIPANGYLLVVKTTPAYFRTRYTVPAGVMVLGPYGGNLSNSDEKLELVRPTDTDELGQTVYTRVDRVVYSDGSHPADCPEGVDLWSVQADGVGKSLSRKIATAYGNDPNNWQAANPTPGYANP